MFPNHPPLPHPSRTQTKPTLSVRLSFALCKAAARPPVLVPVFEAGGAGGGGGAGGAPPAGGGGGAAGAGGAGGAAGAGGAGGTAGEAETAGVGGAGGAAWGLTCPKLAGVGSYIPGTWA